jgi:hypothetical protein
MFKVGTLNLERETLNRAEGAEGFTPWLPPLYERSGLVCFNQSGAIDGGNVYDDGTAR